MRKLWKIKWLINCSNKTWINYNWFIFKLFNELRARSVLEKYYIESDQESFGINSINMLKIYIYNIDKCHI